MFTIHLVKIFLHRFFSSYIGGGLGFNLQFEATNTTPQWSYSSGDCLGVGAVCAIYIYSYK